MENTLEFTKLTEQDRTSMMAWLCQVVAEKYFDEEIAKNF